MKYPDTYVVFDFETSGLSPAMDRVIELAAIKTDRGRRVDDLQALLKWDGLELPPNITEITGIDQALLNSEGQEPKDMIQALLEFMADYSLVGHNIIKFDIPFLFQLAWQTADWQENTHKEFQERVKSNCIDTAVLFKAAKIGMERRWNESFYDFGLRVMTVIAPGVKFNLGLCCDELKIDRTNGQHRAMNDVLLTDELYKKLCLH